jgi:antitoxin MazE
MSTRARQRPSAIIRARCDDVTMSAEEIYLPLEDHGTLSLPSELRRRHHLDSPGAQVRVVERADGVIELHPVVAVPADQAWFWTQRWQQMEREADDDIAAGRIATTDGVDEFLDALDAAAAE